jgi:hypothetical protein
MYVKKINHIQRGQDSCEKHLFCEQHLNELLVLPNAGQIRLQSAITHFVRMNKNPLMTMPLEFQNLEEF